MLQIVDFYIRNYSRLLVLWLRPYNTIQTNNGLDKNVCHDNLFGLFQKIIYELKNLLIFLMGSPIGLKLNYAFNRTLGTFFFYHIFLWKTFMQFMKPYLYSICCVLLFPASFGLSFQAAVLEDLIKICTIHVYCIYIYAAR